MALRTPLYDEHIALGGRMTPFAGYDMPVQFAAGLISEHRAVRERAGLFDASHMGEFNLTGSGSTAFLERVLANEYASLRPGRARYSLMLNESGGTLDDLIVYRKGENDYFIVVNAGNRDSDFEWMRRNLDGDAELTDISEGIALLALQGPLAVDILGTCSQGALPGKRFSFTEGVMIGGSACMAARTGYTGEDGFELYIPAGEAAAVYRALIRAGEPFGLLPCGLGSRDTLRLEAGMPLYGHELDIDTTPIEAGLDFAVKLSKPDFIGKTGLSRPKKRRIGLDVTGKGIAREGCDVFCGDEKAGYVTSGTFSPTLGHPIAMAYITEGSYDKTEFTIDIRGRAVEAKKRPLPFYTPYKPQ